MGRYGRLRLAAHTVIGGLTGGGSGAAGAAVGTLTAPAVAEALAQAGIDGALANTLTALASTAAGAAVGGTAGGGAALNEVANNYLKHQEIIDLIAARKACAGGAGSASACQTAAELEKLNKDRDTALQQACMGTNVQQCAALTQDVRSAQAGILRAMASGQAPEIFDVRDRTNYGLEAAHTQNMADGTLSKSDYATGIAKGATNAILSGLADMAEGTWTGIKSVFGEEESRDKVGKVTADMIKLFNQRETWHILLEQATSQQYLEMADAYEKGDAQALGRIAGNIMGNLVDPLAAVKGVKLESKLVQRPWSWRLKSARLIMLSIRLGLRRRRRRM